jgi:hypothetical protein
MRILLSKFDNVSIAEAAPATGLSGTVVRRIALQDWGDNWFLLALDTPLTYHGQSYDQVLIRSRWAGFEVGGGKSTSVFVLAPPSPEVLDKNEVTSKDFEHSQGH